MNKHVYGYGALAIALLVAAFCWLKAHDAWRDAASFKRGEDNAIHQAQAAGAAAQQHSDQVEKQEKHDVAAIEKKAAAPASTDDTRKLVQMLVPHAQVETIEQPGGAELLAISNTQENRDALQHDKAQCDICSVSLTARNKQFEDAQTRIKAKQDEIAGLTLERDKYKSAADKGSGFWARAKEWGVRIGIAGLGWGAGRITKK
jgi:hypothetical protein